MLSIFADAECFHILDFQFLDLRFILVLVYFMADVPAAKRVRRAIGTVCDACGKIFATSYGFDRHRTSGYLIGTPCHVLDDGSTRSHLVSTARATMSTAMLKKLKASRRKHRSVGKKSTYGAYFAYLINIYLGCNSRRGIDATPPGGVVIPPLGELDEQCL